MKRGGRLKYAVLVILVIALGLLSRRITWVPLLTGDLLYAVMMFLLIRLFWLSWPILQTALVSLTICYCIELSQLWQSPWINHIRSTTLGALVLGRGFLWSDMLAYTLGTGLCYWVAILGTASVQRKK